MISIAHDQSENAHARFLAMLPQIEQIALHSFRGQQPEARAELVQEVVTNCYLAYCRLVQLGKIDRVFATPLARYAVRQINSGRRVGAKLNTGDVLSPANRRVHVEPLERYVRQDEQWKEAVVEDRRATPAETACARLDIAEWFRSLPHRHRQVAQALANGETTGSAAKKYQLTAGRVSQLRRELHASWQKCQGEYVERS